MLIGRSSGQVGDRREIEGLFGEEKIEHFVRSAQLHGARPVFGRHPRGRIVGRSEGCSSRVCDPP